MKSSSARSSSLVELPASPDRPARSKICVIEGYSGSGVKVRCYRFRVWGLGFRHYKGLGFRVYRVWGLGFRVWGLGFYYRFGA